jgi:hypothetical protein
MIQWQILLLLKHHLSPRNIFLPNTWLDILRSALHAQGRSSLLTFACSLMHCGQVQKHSQWKKWRISRWELARTRKVNSLLAKFYFLNDIMLGIQSLNMATRRNNYSCTWEIFLRTVVTSTVWALISMCIRWMNCYILIILLP